MKKIMFYVLLLVISIGVTACGGTKMRKDEAKAENSISFDSASGNSSSYYGYMNPEVPQEAAEYKATAEESKAKDSGENNFGENNTKETISDEQNSNRKLIQRVDMSVETLEFDKFIGILEGKVTTAGGYIETSNLSNNSYSYERLRYANYTVRIPNEKLNEFVTMVGEYANVVNTSKSTEDVTLSYYDTESRKKALVIQQERLLALLEKAENIEDIIQLESRLSDVTYEMETQSTILRNYDNLVEYSTVSLFINEVERETQRTPESITDKMINGLSDTLYDIKVGFENLAVYLVTNLPYLLFWGIVIVIVIVILRKKNIIKGKKKEKRNVGKESEQSEKTETKE